MSAVTPFRLWLDRHGLNQGEVVQRTGFSKTQVSRWVAGRRPLKPAALHAIARAFSASADEIMGRAPALGISPGPVAGLTPAEHEILRHLGHAREIFSRLNPPRTADEAGEFSRVLEAAQALVNARMAGRTRPEAWAGFV